MPPGRSHWVRSLHYIRHVKMAERLAFGPKQAYGAQQTMRPNFESAGMFSSAVSR